MWRNFFLYGVIIVFISDVVCVRVFCSMNGVLEFYDTADVVCMNQAEHFMATDVEWDPTGRYVATSVSWWAHKVEFLLSIKSSKAASHNFKF